MWTKDSSGFKYILLFFNRMILNSGRHTQPDPQSCRVRSLGGRRGGTPKTNNASRDQNKNWAVRRPIVTKRSTANANTEKSIPPAMSQRNQHLTHAMLRKPATTTPKQFQTTWCFINQVSAVLPTPPDSGKTPQLRTSKLAQNCGKTEILHLQPSYGICWSHEIETLPPMWTKDSSGFKYILLFFNRMILNSGRHTQPDPQSCRVRSLGGRRGGPQKQTTHQETKTKTEQCDAQSWQNDPLPTQTQRKASRQQCRSGISTSPTPCCESLRQQHQTTWCFINQVSAVLPTPPDSGKTPQLRTSKLAQNCGKTEILHLQPSYGICWSHEIETLPPMWTKDSSGFKYILLFFNRMILNSGRHTQPDPQSCRVRSLGGRRGGTPKTNNASRDQNKNWAVRRPIVTKRSTANANTEKSIPPAMSQRNQHLTHAMLRKPATTTPKQFQTTWCFINQVSAVLPTPPDSGKTPQLRTSKLAQNCGKTEILHLQPSYGICWSHEIETLPPMWTKDSSGFKYILLFFNRMILNSGRHTQPDPQSCRVRSLGGRRGGTPKTNNASIDQNKNWAVRRPIVTKRSTANANTEKSIPPAMSQRNQHLTHAMLRKPATTTPKQFQTTWCFINQVSAVLPTPPDSGKTPQLRTSKLAQNCGKTEILHLQPSYGICWSHEIETLPPMWTKDSSGFKYILLFFNRMILNSGRHTQPDPQSCRVRSLGGRRGGPQKQTTHQETKTKTEQCDAQSWQNDPLPTQTQKKASRQQCRSGISTSPTPCCESLRQQHPNNSKQHGAL